MITVKFYKYTIETLHTIINYMINRNIKQIQSNNSS